MKKIIALLLAGLSVVSFTFGCGDDGGKTDPPIEPEITTYADADYDGLYDDIDPDKDDNVYDFYFKFNRKTVQNQPFTQFAMDYRKLIAAEDAQFDSDVAVFAALLAQEGSGSVATIKNNVYTNGYSDVSPTLVQFGGRNVQKTTLLSRDFTADKNDRAVITLANHVLLDGGKYKQVFLVFVNGYADMSGWVSNFDVGADTDDYYAITGTHSEWTDKTHHKGFDVTANRLLPIIRKYVNDNKKADAETNVFLTGYSRGAAIVNILAKTFTDENVKTLAYCFNTPNTVTVEPQPVGGKTYGNIINIVNEDDIVPLIPLEEWGGFTRYGKNYYFKVSENTGLWESAFDTEYACLGGDKIAELKSDILTILPTRESIYSFRETPDRTYTDLNFDEKEQLLSEINALVQGTAEKNCIKTVVTENNGVFSVNYYTRPVLIVFAVNAVLQGRIEEMEKYKTALKFYLDEFSDTIDALTANSTPVTYPHVSETDFVGISMISI